MKKNEVSESVLGLVKVKGESRQAGVKILQFTLLLATAVFAPAIGIQAITGTIVNATLFVAASVLGFGAAVLIGIVPSSVSILTGLVPATILPMIPFIIFSNIILISLFKVFKNKSYWKGVVAASFVKFGFLYVVSSFVIQSFVSEKVAGSIALIMGWSQFLTAISGGILAYFVLGLVGRLGKNS